jgi:ComEC/Rec2-related protein
MSSFRWPAVPTSPLSWGVVAFLVGVMTHALFPFDQTPVAIIHGQSLAAIVAALLPIKHRWTLVACVAGLLLGLWRFDATLPPPSLQLESPFTGRVADQGSYNALVRDDATGMVVSLSKQLRIGDHVRVTCKQIHPINHDAKALFDARKGAWFKCKGSATVAYPPQPPGWDPRPLLSQWRTTLTTRIASILPGDAGALLSGMLYGERGLSKETSDAFKMAGMTHLIAVSGSNIAMVAALFVPIFLLLGYRRKPAILLAGAAIMLFVVFVGAQASVVRAATMGWLALLARVFGRKASASRLLVTAAATIVLFDPWSLSFDAGFALSFLATWGLLSWSRPIQEWMTWMPEALGLREAASTTLAATLVTFPYSLWAFGSSSLAGLLTNLIAVPMVGFAMLWGTVALVAGPMIPILTMPARGVLQGMLLIAQVAEYVPFLKVSFRLPTWALFGFYGVIGLFTFFSTGFQKRGLSQAIVSDRKQKQRLIFTENRMLNE